MIAQVTKERWSKLQQLIQELGKLEAAGSMPMNRLEQICRFLIYIARTYEWVIPYLKGLHLTIDSWRPTRDADTGWHLKYLKHLKRDKDGDWILVSDDKDALVEINPQGELRERLAWNIRCLGKLFQGEIPATRTCRATESILGVYLWGNASGKGFGTAVFAEGKRIGDKGEVDYEAAHWKERCQRESSNWREAHNLTSRVEDLGGQGRLTGKEMFLLTDNDTFEKCYYKGHSSSPKLNNIIFRLHKLEQETGAIFHVIHVAGSRMMWVGIDGLSWGDFMTGIMAGKHPLTCLHLHTLEPTRGAGIKSGSGQNPGGDQGAHTRARSPRGPSSC